MSNISKEKNQVGIGKKSVGGNMSEISSIRRYQTKDMLGLYLENFPDEIDDIYLEIKRIYKQGTPDELKDYLDLCVQKLILKLEIRKKLAE